MTTSNDTPIFTEEQARYLKEALLLELQSEQIVKRYDENPTQGNLEAATTILSKMGVYVPYLTGIIAALRADVDAANARAAARERDALMQACAMLMNMEGFTEMNIGGYLIALAPDGGSVNLEVGMASVETTATAQPADGSAAELDSVFGVPVEPSDTEGTGRIVKLNEPKWTRPLRSDDLTDE